MSKEQHRLVLVRHGESMANVWNDAYRNEDMNFLSSLGELQAKIAGIKLSRSNIKFTTMISSNLTRAKHTMALIASQLGDWQREYINTELLNEWHLPTYKHADNSIPQRESQIIFDNRVKDGFDNIIMPALEHGHVLCVTHNYTMNRLFELLNVDQDNMLGPNWRVPNAIPFICCFDPFKIHIMNNEETPS